VTTGNGIKNLPIGIVHLTSGLVEPIGDILAIVSLPQSLGEIAAVLLVQVNVTDYLVAHLVESREETIGLGFALDLITDMPIRIDQLLDLESTHAGVDGPIIDGENQFLTQPERDGRSGWVAGRIGRCDCPGGIGRQANQQERHQP